LVDPLLAGAAAAAGFVGGVMNALAGGGTFATMPTLVALGLPSPIANATSNVALQPGAFASAWAYRAGLRPIAGMGVPALAIITFVGGAIGGMLLAATSERTFDVIVPWLLLLATLVLAIGPRASDWLHDRVAIGRRTLVVVQMLIGIYGGYFGGGVGLMMVAAWGLLSGVAPHGLAGSRTLMLALANSAAMIVFIASGMVAWEPAVPMLIGSTAGGYFGARIGRALAPRWIRLWTLLVTAAMTAIFFVRAYS